MTGGKSRQCSRKAVLIVTALLLLVSLSSISCFSKSESDGNEVLGFPAEWSEDLNLTSPVAYNSCPSIISLGNTVHLFYHNGSNGETYYARSLDAGKTWDKNDIFTPDDIPSSMDPKVAVSGTDINVVWQDSRLQWPTKEIFYQHSGDNGESWDVEFNLSLDDDESSQNPSIACSGSNIHVVWEDYRSDNEYNIYYKMSNDSGVTWQDGQGNIGQDRQLTFATSPSDATLPYIAANGNAVHLIWAQQTTDFGMWETMYMNSTNNGEDWSSPVMLSTHDTYHSGAQGIAVNGIGGVHVLWSEPKSGDYEIGYRNSTDNGASWNPEVRLTNDPAHSDQPDIAINGSHVFITWMDDRDYYDWTGATNGAYELYYIESFDSGASWGPETRLTYAVNNSIQPTVAMDADYIHIAWTDNRTNGSREQIFYKRFPDFPSDPEYNISLNEGWNLISLPLEQSDESIDQVLQSIGGKWDYIQIYDSLDPNHWKSNATYKPDQLNDLKSLDHKMGFWIHITEPDVNLTVRGYITTSTTIPLYAGWNLVGYPTQTEMKVSDALWGTSADRVEVFNVSEPYMIKEIGPEYVMKPGEAYWVRVPVDCTWVVDW